MDPLDQPAFGTLEHSIRIHGVALQGLTPPIDSSPETSPRCGLPYARQLRMPDATDHRRQRGRRGWVTGLEVQAARRYPKD